MKKNTLTLLAGVAMFMLAVVVSSCGSKSESSKTENQKATQEENVTLSDINAAKAELDDIESNDEFDDAYSKAKNDYDEAYDQAKDEYDKAYKQAKDDYDKAYKQAQDDYDKAYKQAQDMLDSYGW